MKQRPIIKGHEIAGRMPLFKKPLRDAIREDRKTMTRRVIKPQPHVCHNGDLIYKDHLVGSEIKDRNDIYYPEIDINPYGIQGQYRVMTEPLIKINGFAHYDDDKAPVISTITNTAMRWIWLRNKLSSIHMPYEAARTVTEYTGVSVERVQEITPGDILREGTPNTDIKYNDPWSEIYGDFQHLWDSINGKRDFGWDKNNWVWVIGFRRVK